jgi:hypothetical protein
MASIISRSIILLPPYITSPIVAVLQSLKSFASLHSVHLALITLCGDLGLIETLRSKSAPDWRWGGIPHGLVADSTSGSPIFHKMSDRQSDSSYEAKSKRRPYRCEREPKPLINSLHRDKLRRRTGERTGLRIFEMSHRMRQARSRATVAVKARVKARDKIQRPNQIFEP